MKNVPQKYDDLLADETKAIAFLGTIMADGSPQVTPLWFDVKDDHIMINTALGRTKDRNLRRNPMVALAIIDPKNPYRYLQIRGKVIDIQEDNNREHIDTLSMKYHGKSYPVIPGQTRVVYLIEPIHISGNG